MDGASFTTYSYKMRTGGPIPVAPAVFVAQTFGANKYELTFWEATKTLPETTDFIGASVNGKYSSASFQRLPYLTEDGEQIFRGSTTGKEEFIHEDEVPGT